MVKCTEGNWILQNIQYGLLGQPVTLKIYNVFQSLQCQFRIGFQVLELHLGPLWSALNESIS